jgi:hypothetical protein
MPVLKPRPFAHFFANGIDGLHHGPGTVQAEHDGFGMIECMLHSNRVSEARSFGVFLNAHNMPPVPFHVVDDSLLTGIVAFGADHILYNLCKSVKSVDAPDTEII